MEKQKVVIAGNHVEFKNYCHHNNLRTKDVIYASSLSKIKNLRNCELIKVGTFWKSPVYNHEYLNFIEY